MSRLTECALFEYGLCLQVVSRIHFVTRQAGRLYDTWKRVPQEASDTRNTQESRNCARSGMMGSRNDHPHPGSPNSTLSSRHQGQSAVLGNISSCDTAGSEALVQTKSDRRLCDTLFQVGSDTDDRKAVRDCSSLNDVRSGREPA